MDRRMVKSYLVVSFLCAACSVNAMHISRESPIGPVEYRSSTGVVRIDVAARVITVNRQSYPLENCSNDDLYCLKSDTVGFHVVFPRNCRRPYDAAGETMGGALFFQIALVPHEGARNGRYSSELSDRFAYDYTIRRGLHALRFDPTGQWRFGPRSNGNDMGSAAREPFIYRLAEGQAFLRCR